MFTTFTNLVFMVGLKLWNLFLPPRCPEALCALPIIFFGDLELMALAFPLLAAEVLDLLLLPLLTPYLSASLTPLRERSDIWDAGFLDFLLEACRLVSYIVLFRRSYAIETLGSWRTTERLGECDDLTECCMKLCWGWSRILTSLE